MQITNPYLFVHIGLVIRLLRKLETDSEISFAAAEAENLVASFGKAQFAVSAAGSHRLNKLVQQFRKESAARKLTVSEIAEFRGIMDVLEPMVFAEAQTKRLYSLGETR